MGPPVHPSLTPDAAQKVLDRGEALASVLPPLLAAAERVASTVAGGFHGRRRVGRGETFWQFRRYQPGDDPHAVDWRQSARRDALYVREYEWAAAQTVWLWCDRSNSMRYRSSPALPLKQDRAALLLMALAVLLVRGGERIAWLDGTGHEIPALGRGALVRLATAISHGLRDGSDGTLPAAAALPRHAGVVLIGDFLAPLPDIENAVRRLSGRGITGHLLQVLDPAEESLPFSGRIRFTGLENEGETVIARTEDVRDAYCQRLAEQRDGLRAIARSTGWTFATHHTESSAESALLSLYAALARPSPYRGKGI
ncbi:MAG: DUF58 domain-containing protein [Alphaproteobacteria bacterium]|nr:DUF58 domain-containing protein [Alphaproteobacteria bacterium]